VKEAPESNLTEKRSSPWRKRKMMRAAARNNRARPRSRPKFKP
jgi:hypothetical protein